MDKTNNRIRNPFPPVCDDTSRILILGSLPSEASREAGFYYMNPRNRFWQMLSNLLGEDLVSQDKEGKRAVLLRRHVALSDVIDSCDIHRSADASIKNATPSDIPYILNSAPIKHIFLNGKTAYALFEKHFPEYLSMATALPSTSPANAKKSLADLIEDWGKELLPFLK